MNRAVNLKHLGSIVFNSIPAVLLGYVLLPIPAWSQACGLTGVVPCFPVSTPNIMVRAVDNSSDCIESTPDEFVCGVTSTPLNFSRPSPLTVACVTPSCQWAFSPQSPSFEVLWGACFQRMLTRKFVDITVATDTTRDNYCNAVIGLDAGASGKRIPGYEFWSSKITLLHELIHVDQNRNVINTLFDQYRNAVQSIRVPISQTTDTTDEANSAVQSQVTTLYDAFAKAVKSALTSLTMTQEAEAKRLAYPEYVTLLRGICDNAFNRGWRLTQPCSWCDQKYPREPPDGEKPADSNPACWSWLSAAGGSKFVGWYWTCDGTPDKTKEPRTKGVCWEWRDNMGNGRPGFAAVECPEVCKPEAFKEKAGNETCTSPDSSMEVEIITSADPNDKVGAPGVSALRFIQELEPQRYMIFFENKPTATAPAQEVVVMDQLDRNSLDLSALILGPITFPSKTVTVPSLPLTALGKFSTTADLRPLKDLQVQISAELNSLTGILTWRFRSIDPATGQLPDDPLAGFLPISAGGSVSFFAPLKSGLATGTAVRNKASIVFDTNPPLETPEWINTIDSSTPVSRVSTLPTTQYATAFPITWQGSDSGSGIKSYTIYVSDNGNPFAVWQSDIVATSAVFMGLIGHTYSFYSIARDQTGNVEGAKTSAEATTTIIPSPTCAGNGTAQFAITRSGFRFNNATQRFVQNVIVTKMSVDVLPISGPVVLVLDSLSPNATLFNSAGRSTCAVPADSPYVILKPAGQVWNAGERISTVLEFTNTNNQGINYNTRVLVGPGNP